MQRTRPILAIAFSLLIASSMVVVPASAAFTESTTQPTPHSGTASTAPLDAATTGASTLEHTTADDVPEIGGETPRDLDGDGRYEDVNGDGSLSNGDITHFFGHQHLPPAQEHVEYFDFDGNGDVGQSDVVLLFDALSADDPTDVIVPVEPTDTDEDGLPDRFEANVAGTDPHDANSSSTLTDVNESQNDVLDGAEDLSGNGVPLVYAAEYDLDPLENDTDGDGLPDDVEIMQSELDPTAADSNGDGTPDGEADLDGDGLTNAEEAERGTAIRRADSDGDGIEDGEEIEFGSDPRERDTDGDGLADSAEQRLGTDPTAADSDGDGTLDSEEQFEVEHTEPTTDVTVTAVGTGATPTQLTVHSLQNYHNGTEPSAGPTVSVSNVDEQNDTSIALPVTEQVAEEDLAVYTRKPERNATWQPLPSEYDSETGVITADIEGDRQVSVLNASAWESGQNVSVHDAAPVQNMSLTCHEGCTIADDGSIVLGPDGEDSTADRLAATTLGICPNEFPDYTNDCDGDGVDDENDPCPNDRFDNCDSDFDGVPDDEDPCPDDALDSCVIRDSDQDGVLNEDDPCPDDPNDQCDEADEEDDDNDGWDSTDDDDDGDSNDEPSDSDGDGVDDSDDECPNLAGEGANGCPFEGDASASVYIPLAPDTVTLTTWFDLSSGTADDITITVEGTERTRDATVSGVGIESELDVAHVDVSDFGGDEVTASISVTGTSARVAGFEKFSDHDGDELVDDFENDPPHHPETGNELQTDQYSVDSDGDGLEDGEEVTTEFDGAKWKVDTAFADPTVADSDGDGLDDEAELALGTDPYEPDTDGDELDDDLETSLGTDPLDSDTDGDGMDDSADPAPLTAGDGSADTTLAEETAGAAEALSEGAGLGEAGMPDGANPSEHSDSPFYIVGWLGSSFIPVAGTGADVRDATQNLANGDWVDAGLDGIGLITVVGDGIKGLAKIKDWLKTFEGKSDELLQTLRATGFLDRIPTGQQDDIIDATGKERSYRVATDGGKNLPPIGPKIEKANDLNAGKLEDGKRFTEFDVAKRGKDPDSGDAIVLMDTGKWDAGNNIPPEQTIGFRHIIARHAHPDTNYPDAFSRTKGYEVDAGGRAYSKTKGKTQLFPKAMHPQEVQELIMRAATSPNRQVVKTTNYLKEVKYSVPASYKYDVEKVTVLIRTKEGMIKTAHPSGSKSPRINHNG